MAVEDLRMTSCGTIVFGLIGYVSVHLLQAMRLDEAGALAFL